MSEPGVIQRVKHLKEMQDNTQRLIDQGHAQLIECQRELDQIAVTLGILPPEVTAPPMYYGGSLPSAEMDIVSPYPDGLVPGIEAPHMNGTGPQRMLP
jgi:hypothetical protein